MKIGWMLAVAALVVGGGAGCADLNLPGIGGAADEEAKLQQVLRIDDPKLARLLRVDDVLVGQTKTGLLKASVKLASRRSKDLEVRAQYVWLDEAGAEIASGSDSWRSLVLQARKTRTVRGVAPSVAATDFKLRVRAKDKPRKIAE